LVEKDLLGGTCLNRGCIPTKSLLHAGEVVQTMEESKTFGVNCKGYTIDFKAMMARKQAVVNQLRNGVQGLLKKKKVNIVTGSAELLEPGKVKITSEPPGATITLNGEPTDLVTPADMELPGGDHALALNLEGYIMETRAFTVPIGGAVVVDVPLTGTAAAAAVDLPLPDEDVEIDFDEEEPAEKEQKVGPGVWAMVGVTGAGLVSSTVFGLLALSEQADFDNNPSKSKKDRGEAFALACDISIGVTAAAAITGVVLYLVGAKKERKEREAAEEAVETFDEPAEDAPPVENASIYPIISPDMAGAGFGFDF